MQICRLFFTAFWNFWRITRFSTTNHCWVINAQTGPVFFGPPCRTVQTRLQARREGRVKGKLPQAPRRLGRHFKKNSSKNFLSIGAPRECFSGPRCGSRRAWCKHVYLSVTFISVWSDRLKACWQFANKRIRKAFLVFLTLYLHALHPLFFLILPEFDQLAAMDLSFSVDFFCLRLEPSWLCKKIAPTHRARSTHRHLNVQLLFNLKFTLHTITATLIEWRIPRCIWTKSTRTTKVKS